VHRPWQEVDVQEGGLTSLLCGCLSLGPPADWHIATLLQECGAWATVPAWGTTRMTTWLTLHNSTPSALLPTAPLICSSTYRFGCPRPCLRQCPQRARRDSPRGQQGGPVSGGPRVAPARGEQSRAESLVAGAKFGRASTTLVESHRVETTMIVSWTHIFDRCY
jgi:hypothetical protein